MLSFSVRESVTVDLIERLIVDIIEITEGLDGTYLASTYESSGWANVFSGAEGSMMSTMTKQVPHQPDHEHARPDKANFGDADVPGGQQQSGFSSQCWAEVDKGKQLSGVGISRHFSSQKFATQNNGSPICVYYDE